MQVVVFGASGFIGHELCKHLLSTDHKVIAVVRNERKGWGLKATNSPNYELHIVPDLTKPPETLHAAVAACDAIVHLVADYSNFDAVDDAVMRLVEKRAESAKPCRFLYCSGVLVYPSSEEVQDEESPADPNANPIMTHRIANEKKALALPAPITGTVARPGYVYGGRSKHFVPYFAQAARNRVVIAGQDCKGDPYHPPGEAYSEVYIDDLVAGLSLQLAAPAEEVRGEVFNFTDESQNTNLDIARVYAQAAANGLPGKGVDADVKYVEPEGEEDGDGDGQVGWCFLPSKTVLVSSAKAKRVLGWEPKAKPLVEQADELFAEWKTYDDHNQTNSRGCPDPAWQAALDMNVYTGFSLPFWIWIILLSLFGCLFFHFGKVAQQLSDNGAAAYSVGGVLALYFLLDRLGFLDENKRGKQPKI